MKKIIYCIASLLLMASFNSCEDISTYNNPSHHQLESGAYVRFVNIPPTSFVPEDVQSINISEEVYDANGNVSLYELSVEVTLTSTGLNYVADNIITIDTFPNTVNITSQFLADAIGVDVTDFGAGDFVSFTGVATRNDGVKFYGVTPSFDDDTLTVGIGNTENNLLVEEAYKDAMTFDWVIACPISDELYSGTYNLVNTIEAPCGGLVFLEQEVELEVLSVYQRTFSAIYLEQFAIGNGPRDFIINLICGSVTFADNQATGLGCSETIFLNASDMAGPYDETNDAELTVNFQEKCDSCAGGEAAFETQIVLTKI